eukprot:Phypoly_transcript_10369.p1 GENE.Phypoly_transcript_10369~~Phypoly_transcript_10369.p1  ORF type:complete len:158 (+),score=11.33 Phypoly_transcript_10369:720-1193(+)
MLSPVWRQMKAVVKGMGALQMIWHCMEEPFGLPIDVVLLEYNQIFTEYPSCKNLFMKQICMFVGFLCLLFLFVFFFCLFVYFVLFVRVVRVRIVVLFPLFSSITIARLLVSDSKQMDILAHFSLNILSLWMTILKFVFQSFPSLEKLLLLAKCRLRV